MLFIQGCEFNALKNYTNKIKARHHKILRRSGPTTSAADYDVWEGRVGLQRNSPHFAIRLSCSAGPARVGPRPKISPEKEAHGPNWSNQTISAFDDHAAHIYNKKLTHSSKGLHALHCHGPTIFFCRSDNTISSGVNEG